MPPLSPADVVTDEDRLVTRLMLMTIQRRLTWVGLGLVKGHTDYFRTRYRGVQYNVWSEHMEAESGYNLTIGILDSFGNSTNKDELFFHPAIAKLRRVIRKTRPSLGDAIHHKFDKEDNRTMAEKALTRLQ